MSVLEIFLTKYLKTKFLRLHCFYKKYWICFYIAEPISIDT